MQKSSFTILSALTFVIAACSSYPQPRDSLVNSTSAVRGAQEAGAAHAPEAALHLRLAKEENELAKKLMEEGENERAAFVLQRAQSDADLALALAHEQETRQRAQAADAAARGAQPGNTSYGNENPQQ